MTGGPAGYWNMDITGLGWCGTRTEDDEELARFYEHVLGLRRVLAEPGFWVFELPDGRHVEVFGPRYPGQEHFGTGPVVGFAVRDLPAAAEELGTRASNCSVNLVPHGSISAAPTATSTNSSPAEAPGEPGGGCGSPPATRSLSAASRRRPSLVPGIRRIFYCPSVPPGTKFLYEHKRPI